MQLKCCGVRNLWDYSNVTVKWEPRIPEALAPLTCCTGLSSSNNTYPPDNWDSLFCIATGDNPEYYHQQVRFVVLIHSTYRQQNTIDISLTVMHVVYWCNFYRATACNTTHDIAKAFLSVCPSVSLCVKRVRTLWQNERNLSHILIPHERSFILVFWQEEWVSRATPSTWNFGPNWHCYSENADFQSIFARSASAIT